MFAEPERTSWDLNFRLFGFRIRIHPLFWLGAALLGANNANRDDGYGLAFFLIWIVVVLVSILVHEFGHAIAFRRFGTDAHIVLWVFGGLAVPNSSISGRGRRILVALAGPVAGFILCGLVYGSNKLLPWATAEAPLPVQYLYLALVYVNLFWGIFNLLPVFPLDGGQVSRELCGAKWPGRGLGISLKISIGVAAAVAVFSVLGALDVLTGLPWWAQGSWYTAILFAMLAAQSYLLLQQVERGGGYYYEAPDDDRPPWK